VKTRTQWDEMVDAVGIDMCDHGYSSLDDQGRAAYNLLILLSRIFGNNGTLD